MNYYFCISEAIVIDLSNITSFITERIKKNGIEITILSLDDKNYLEFLQKSKISNHLTEEDNCIIVLGEDEYLYRLSLGGFEQIKNSKGATTLKQYINSTYKYTKYQIKSNIKVMIIHNRIHFCVECCSYTNCEKLMDRSQPKYDQIAYGQHDPQTCKSVIYHTSHSGQLSNVQA